MTIARWLFGAGWFLLAVATAYAQDSAVLARLATDTVTLGDTVRLEIVAINAGEDLDTSALEQDFAVAGRQSSRQVTQVNGTVSSRISWLLELEPLRAGQLPVPPVVVGGVASNALVLTVEAAPTGAARDVFVEMSVDEPRPWVQAQVILSVKVYSALTILDGALSSPAADGLSVTPLGTDRQARVTLDGREYQLTERRFALFPQQSGEVRIDPILLTVNVAENPSGGAGAFSRTRKLRRRSDAVVLDVRPRDARDTSAWWLPATAVTIDDAWSSDHTALSVGQPVTRTVTVRAEGVGDTQLPALAFTDVRLDGVNLYPDQPVRDTQAGETGLAATLSLSMAVIPARAGTWTLPAVDIDWFDVTSGEPRTATLPPVTLTVTATAGDAAPAAQDATPARQAAGVEPSSPASTNDAAVTDSNPVTPSPTVGDTRQVTTWRVVALLLAAGWVSTVLAWWWRARYRRRIDHATVDVTPTRERSPSLALAWRWLQQQCREGRPVDVARALLAWAAVRWPDDPPRSLVALSRRVDDTEAAARIASLDAALYRPAGDAAAIRVDDLGELPRLLAHAVDDGRESSGRHSPGASDVTSALPPL